MARNPGFDLQQYNKFLLKITNENPTEVKTNAQKKKCD